MPLFTVTITTDRRTLTWTGEARSQSKAEQVYAGALFQTQRETGEHIRAIVSREVEPSCGTCHWNGRADARCGLCAGPTATGTLNQFEPKEQTA